MSNDVKQYKQYKRCKTMSNNVKQCKTISNYVKHCNQYKTMYTK